MTTFNTFRTFWRPSSSLTCRAAVFSQNEAISSLRSITITLSDSMTWQKDQAKCSQQNAFMHIFSNTSLESYLLTAIRIQTAFQLPRSIIGVLASVTRIFVSKRYTWSTIFVFETWVYRSEASSTNTVISAPTHSILHSVNCLQQPSNLKEILQQVPCF